MIGFFCLGRDARVSGGRYDEDHLDLGFGLRPDLTGCGHGHLYFEAVLCFASVQEPARPLRATIAAWNQRAIRLCQRAGFRVFDHFISQRGDIKQDYVVMLRPAAT